MGCRNKGSKGTDFYSGLCREVRLHPPSLGTGINVGTLQEPNWDEVADATLHIAVSGSGEMAEVVVHNHDEYEAVKQLLDALTIKCGEPKVATWQIA